MFPCRCIVRRAKCLARRCMTLLAQEGPRKAIVLDRPELFLRTLAQAVDHEDARQIMERRLYAAEQSIHAAQSAIDEYEERSRVLQESIQDAPLLENAIQNETDAIMDYRYQLIDATEDRDLLKQRLMEWRCQQDIVLKETYRLMNVFVAAVDARGEYQGILTTNLVMRLKQAANGARILEQEIILIEKAREEYSSLHKARRSRAFKPRRLVAERSRTLQETEGRYTIEKAIQQQRETTLLAGEARPFLINCGFMFVGRRTSDVSSQADVGPIGAHPNPHWSGFQGHLVPVNDGVRSPTAEIEDWLYERKKTHKQRKHVDRFQTVYTSELANHFYAFSTATLPEFDAIIEERIGGQLDNKKAAMADSLYTKQLRYQEARDAAAEAAIEDLPISPDWAASVDDEEPDQTEEILWDMSPAAVEARGRRIRRWNRRTARKRPFGPDGGTQPLSGPISPAGYRELRSPLFGVDSDGEISSCLTPRTRHRRVRHMSVRASGLRRKFESTAGLQYEADKIRVS